MDDGSYVAFAAVSAVALTPRRLLVRGALLGGVALLAAGPAAGDRLGLGPAARGQLLAAAAFAFNAFVTALVARRVFRPGRVTGRRVQGAVLVYLNVASFFVIAYGLLDAHAPGTAAPAGGGPLAATIPGRIAALTYFSLTTLTTTGYGDLAPVHPLARSLANLEGTFGQLFPATLLARLVALHQAHGREEPADSPT